MSTHTVVFTTTASSYVEVSEEEVQAVIESGVEDREEAIEQAAWDKFGSPYLCAQCAGAFKSSRTGIELSGDWEITEDGIYE